MQRRFPDLEPEDAIQETLLALVDALPTYRYVPGETGCFHNYLTGILWHKALNMRRANHRRENRHDRYREDMTSAASAFRRLAAWAVASALVAFGAVTAVRDIFMQAQVVERLQ